MVILLHIPFITTITITSHQTANWLKVPAHIPFITITTHKSALHILLIYMNKTSDSIMHMNELSLFALNIN